MNQSINRSSSLPRTGSLSSFPEIDVEQVSMKGSSSGSPTGTLQKIDDQRGKIPSISIEEDRRMKV